MNLLIPRRQLINLAVVAAAVGANAFVAWTQIGTQREIDARAAQAARVRHDLDRFREALGGGLAALGRFESGGVTEPADARARRAAALDEAARSVRAELADNPALLARFDTASLEALTVARDIDDTLARVEQRVADAQTQAAASSVAPAGSIVAAAPASGAARVAGASAVAAPVSVAPGWASGLYAPPGRAAAAPTGAASTVTAATTPLAALTSDAETWATTEYIRLDTRVDRLDARLSSLQGAEDLALAAALSESSRSSSRASALLIVTMLAGATLLLYTFGARESAAREKLRGTREIGERFQGLFDAHPVPMYVFDRETLGFLAVNAAAIQQYGYGEDEFLTMTIREIRVSEDVPRLEQHLARSDTLTPNVRTMAGIWHHRRRDGSTISANISHHALTFLGRAAVFVLAEDVSDQIRVEAEAQRSNQMLETVIDNIPQRIFWKDADSRYLGCNMTFARDAGLAYPEQVIGKTDEELPWRAYALRMQAQDREVLESGLPNINFEDDLTIDGVHKTTLTSKLPMLDGEGRVIGVIGSFTDTTERKRADLALRLQSRALDACVNAILITAPGPGGSNLIEYANPAFRRITGYDPAEVIGLDSRLLQRDDRDQDGLITIRESLGANREVSAVLRNYRKDGGLFWNQLLIAPVPDLDGRTTHHIGIINDVTELIRYQEQLEYQANYDSLTLLPNRNLLRDRLQQALVSAHRHERGVAVVFIDLDGFKNVNDSLGHSVGDRLLRVVAERLARCTRTSDTVARHGGDEFVIVLTDTIDEKSLINWMERARAMISEPVWLDGTELYVGCSLGASVFPQDGNDAETLLKKADVAMYRAKDMGRNTFQFFQPEMNASVGARMNLERRLRRALRDGEFRLHYQPLVEVESGRIVGMEALVRWYDPETGLVPPAQFIPVAEESGLIGPLSDWVLREACRQNRAWQRDGLPAVRVSVNLSARVFQQRNIAQLVTEVLAETGLAACYLELELTESTLMRNAEEAVSMLNELHALGIGISVDDFGTGYSSLSYLKRLPVDRLKIDRSFVADIGTSVDDETITAAIIALAHELQLQVIAEGVETSSQYAFLRERECDEMQGFFFAPPLPGEDIAALLGASVAYEGTGAAWMA
ncbi:sensor domain-containing protein [Paraburkholderia ferrariae]|uniref:sensor domain-containing protein n=1 Tax=Paraburkholderia ferrariae TaxID=386056 RepID=UPI0005A99765|nr:EAL domain-containing protein [Paraburkholderia ferrariae]